jgi:hypothetical protein
MQNKDMIPFKICSFYANTTNTFSIKNNIELILDHFFLLTNGHSIDVMCLQGIDSFNSYKDIINGFINKLEKIKNKNKNKNKNNLQLFYYPNLLHITNNLWNEQNESTYSKLIISRSESLISLYKKAYIYNDDNKNNIQIININIHNTIISIYNIDIYNITTNKTLDSICDNINKIIELNCDEINIKINSNQYKRNIHLLCGNFGVSEIINNTLSKMYVKLITKLNLIDILKYIAIIRNKYLETNKNGVHCVNGVNGVNSEYTYSTNIFGTRNNFIMCRTNEFYDTNTNTHTNINTNINENINTHTKIIDIGKSIYKKYGIVKVDAFISENFNDSFLNYPSTIMIFIDKNWCSPVDNDNIDDNCNDNIDDNDNDNIDDNDIDMNEIIKIITEQTNKNNDDL